MADIGGSTNDAFGDGLNHQVLDSHENTQSIVLDGALQRDSDHWDALTPHGVLNTALGGSAQDDGSWEQYQREQGGYQPGSMTAMQDQIQQGNGNVS